MSLVDAMSRIGGIEQQINTLRQRPPVPGRFEHVLNNALQSITGSEPETTLPAGGGTTTNRGAGLIGMLGAQVNSLGTLNGVSFPQPLATMSSEGPPRGELAELLPERGTEWADEIEAAAAEYALDARYLAAVVWTESSFRPDAVSRSGALGLSQLMPATAADLGVNPNDPVDNLRGGAKYLRRLLDEFGRVDLAAAAYNAGPGRVRENGGFPYIADPGGYVQTVVTHYRDLGGTHP